MNTSRILATSFMDEQPYPAPSELSNKIHNVRRRRKPDRPTWPLHVPGTGSPARSGITASRSKAPSSCWGIAPTGTPIILRPVGASAIRLTTPSPTSPQGRPCRQSLKSRSVRLVALKELTKQTGKPQIEALDRWVPCLAKRDDITLNRSFKANRRTKQETIVSICVLKLHKNILLVRKMDLLAQFLPYFLVKLSMPLCFLNRDDRSTPLEIAG